MIPLATQCSQTAKALQSELVLLRKPPRSGLRGTVGTVWLKTRKAKKIQKLKLALDEFQKTLDSKILIDVRQALGTFDARQEGQSKRIEQQLSQLSSNLKNCNSTFAGQLRSEIDRCIEASEAQHKTTRDHITTAMHDLSVSQRGYVNEQREQQHFRGQHDQFIKSLQFDEMQTRVKQIEESQAETFHWMFEDDATGPWDSFSRWLKEGDHVYWINGKPGSGKSTLLKFLVDNPRTGELLAQWSPDRHPLIVKFYFWLSGTKMQRSLKGFLCSVIYQLIDNNKPLTEQLLRGNRGLLSKCTTNDWSIKELREILVHSIDLLDHPLCMFLDGLDEFDRDDDVDQLLDLVENLFKSKTTKICISSRPEHYIAKRMRGYKQLRLQDLTAKDMDVCIRTKLEDTRTRCLPCQIDDENLKGIIKIISEKADGVFLWVYYALSSLVRGLRNEDNFGDLLGRIKELPNGMHQLYLQMWNRLNEDKQHYQEEAATYFSYLDTPPEINAYVHINPISLFELLVAMDPHLQDTMVDKFQLEDPSILARDCEALKNRVMTRTAGLLEILRYPVPDNEETVGTETTSQKADKKGAIILPSNKNLRVHYDSKIQYLHRTARDFLTDTEDGHKIRGNPRESPPEMEWNIMRAHLATQSWGFKNIYDCMPIIADYFDRHPNPRLETVTVVNSRRANRNAIPGLFKYRYVGHYVPVESPNESRFECCAAYYGFAGYVQNFIQSRDPYINPYCRGLLALEAMIGIETKVLMYIRGGKDVLNRTIQNLDLISWLASNEADFHAPHRRPELAPYYTSMTLIPASTMLFVIHTLSKLKNDTILRQCANNIHTILPYLEMPSCTDIVKLRIGQDWRINPLFAYASWPTSQRTFLVQLSIPKLHCLIKEKFERRVANVYSAELCSQPDISKEPPTRVLWVCRTYKDPEIRERSSSESSDNPVSDFRLSLDDSIYLGEALDKIFFSGSSGTPSIQAYHIKNFEERLCSVIERSPAGDAREWMGEYMKAQHDEASYGDASGLDCDPSGNPWIV